MDVDKPTFSEKRYQSMQYRRSGKSGLLLPLLSLGAYRTFGGYCDAATARACLYRAFDLGITHFDLANNYGTPPGNAERIVGQILQDMPRDELIISSKAGYHMWEGPYGEWLSKKHIIASIDQSLKRLGLDYVDIFYAHRPDPETPLEETMEALDQIVRQGKALYIGVSNFPGAHLEQAIQITKTQNLTPITIHQPRYNIIDRRQEHNLFDHTERNGVGVITFSALAQGRLSQRYLEKSVEEKEKKQQEQIQKLAKIAQHRGQSITQMALSWSLRLSAVTSVLIGASEVGQIEENVAALNNLKFSHEELDAIDAISPRLS